ncbi:glycoside hydrolase family 97 catalytic domain-containing protein [Kribbella sp. CA-293567]|uniref:glycoside hydrolase family 97 catalytic domain-containing protein n=1 Tax=Kribbella sp. CA-293567 TaxID=3002436 RepID=UPI0022DE2D55|nr:glycoside hydrolase family 97 catalytic domain-containing protein [Kribbella sp. CA-293567]WBQ02641.1 glycoside hydrolase family 97 catalytic domain-containing protein [Kribbella sp. CA-293567]
MLKLLSALLPLTLLTPLTLAVAAVDGDQTWVLPGVEGVGASLESASGRLKLKVSSRATEVVSVADLGLITAAGDLSKDLALTAESHRTLRSSYRMTTGKQRDRSVFQQESRLTFGNASGSFALVVRVSDDGVAFRYELPGPVTVQRETGGYTFAADTTNWLQPYNAQHENEHAQATAATAPTGQFGHPALFRAGSNYTLLAEAGVDGRYSGARLTHTQGSSRYDVQLADPQVVSSGPLATAWRTMIVGELADVTASTLVDDLADPARFTDTNWIRPGLSSWSWLAENSSPGNFERQKDYVDAAAKNGLGFVLVDEGWKPAWLPELTRYARARGVDVLVWFHWTNLQTQAQRDEWLPKLVGWGVKGVKVDFMESDTQARYQWYDAILADTAKYRLMINFHGSTVPHGLARTWPHVMTMEGVRGEENGLNAARNTILPFTRNVIGSMDYTPTRFATAANPKPETTNAHELALPVVYESGWTHVVSTPEELASQPEGARYLAQLPTAWDETRLIAGVPGEQAVMARRSGTRWFAGGITAGAAGTIAVPLSFLGGSQQWLVEVVTDNGRLLARSSSVRRATDELSLAVGNHGGFALQACPYATGLVTCDKPRTAVPGTTVLVDASADQIVTGGTVKVQGVFVARTGGPVRNLTLAPEVPAGWTLVAGAPVTRNRLNDGESVSGNWTLRLDAGGARGKLELVVAGKYTAPDGRLIHSAGAAPIFAEPLPPRGATYVSDLPWTDEVNGYGRPQQRDHNHGGDRPPGTLTIAGKTFAKGIGAHAASSLTTWLGGACTRFVADVGVDDGTESDDGSVTFVVVGDGQTLADTPVIRAGEAATHLDLDVTGIKSLTLATTDGGNGKNSDHADWGGAALTCAG